MAGDGSGGGFGWGFVLGGLIGVVAGAYLASGPGRGQVATLRQQTIELTGPGSDLRRAVETGIAAARRRRAELEAEAVPEAPEQP